MLMSCRARTIRFCEELESRRLMSIALVASQVVIAGNDQANTIVIARTAKFPATKYTVALDSTVMTFRISDVSSFNISALGGNDTIAIDSSRGTIAALRIADLGAGNDVYNGSAGRDQVAGASGNDRINSGSGNDAVSGGSGSDTISGGSGNDAISGGGDADNLVGSDGDDVLAGGAEADGISGGEGNDSISGDAGNDTLIGSLGHDIIQGGDGDDAISGGAQSNYLYGDGGNDTISGSGAGDVIGGDGEDLLPTTATPAAAPTGNDRLIGLGGPDTLLAQRGADTVLGGDGSDLLDARGNNDSISDRTNDEVRPVEQAYVGNPATVNTITLKIVDNSKNVMIPASAGNFAGGTSTARVTTVAADGTATIQFSDIVNRRFTLGEFFKAWGVSFDRVHIGRQQAMIGAPLLMFVNGAANTRFDTYQIVGGESVVVTYG
jgi:Ca2+-binding RTX toxin-like protein